MIFDILFFQIDFVDLKMYKPQQKDLRRVFQTGVWVHYKTFPHSTQFHAASEKPLSS